MPIISGGAGGGSAGPQGPSGASAYEVAVAEGFVGDETAWLASLVGPAGADGTNGTNGADGTDGADGADGVVPSGSTFPTNPTLNQAFQLTGNGIRDGIYYADTGTKNCWLSEDIGVFTFHSPAKSGTNVPLHMTYALCVANASGTGFGFNPPFPCEIVALEIASATVSTATVTAVSNLTGLASVSLSSARTNKVEVTAAANITGILTGFLETGSIGASVFSVYYRRRGTIVTT